MLGSQDEEGRAEERVRPGREDREVEVELLAAKDRLGALGAADPVALHRDHVLGPRLEQVEVRQQTVGVVGDPEVPLLQLLRHDLGAATLAAAVDDLLVGEHGLILGTPVDRGVGLVGQAGLEQAQEDPLGPAVVLGLMGRDLAAPVHGDAPGPELLTKARDRPLGRDPRVLTGPDRMILGGQTERVVPHGLKHAEAVAAPVVSDRIADRVDLEVADVGLAGGVGEHDDHVGLGLLRIEAGVAGIRHLPRLLLRPDPLPLALEGARVVAGGLVARGGAGLVFARHRMRESRRRGAERSPADRDAGAGGIDGGSPNRPTRAMGRRSRCLRKGRKWVDHEPIPRVEASARRSGPSACRGG